MNNALLLYWSSIHFFCILLAIPTITLIIFGFLAYRNIRHLTNTRQLNGSDRQLVLMVCLQLILVIVSTAPFGAYNTYILATSSMIKTTEQLDQDFLFLTITSLFGVFNFGVSFSFINCNDLNRIYDLSREVFMFILLLQSDFVKLFENVYSAAAGENPMRFILIPLL